jgi:serine/threonine-protein kinase
VDSATWQRLAPLVDQALELSGAERGAFLERLRIEDPGLGDAVEAFLASEAKSRGFLDVPVDARAAALLEVIGEDDRSWDAVQLEGSAVGPYRLVRELGRGGMGTVFLAERGDGGFEQRVAVKLVKRGMDTDEILARFQRERQILARLEHPHVARLLDGGVSAGGQPYFAMEFVDGTPLTRYCDARRLSIEARLRLLLQICDAVEYAHRSLVVHRDIKPSNVLVTAEGQAKLLDFGIAKVLDSAAADGSPTVTRRDDRAVTPQYAAPELLLGEPVTTATDVYSLGVVLYELLCGRLPRRLRSVSLAEIETALRREAEPASAAVRRAEPPEPDGSSSAATAEEIAEARGLAVERLARRLRGDLDNVAAKALSREPTRRYGSVAAFAEDLRRHLEGRPVSARRVTLAYRATRFVGRHRWAVSGAALLVASLVAGLSGTLWQARRAVNQANRADEVKRFTLSLFEVADPDAAQGKEITARQLLDRGAQRIDAELAGQPEIQAEMLLVVGNIYHRLGMDRESLPLFERALQVRKRAPGGDELGVAEAELAVGGAGLLARDLDKAGAFLDAALEKRRRLRGNDHPETAFACSLLGQLRFERADLEGAQALLDEAVRVQRRHAPATSADLATTLTVLGRVHQTLGELDLAEPLYREALEVRRRLHGDQHSAVAAAVFNVATVLQEKGDIPGSEVLYREVLSVHRRLLGPNHDMVANVLNNLATALIVKGQYREAERLLGEALDIRRQLHGADSPHLASGLHNLARALRPQGRLVEAESKSRQAVALAAGVFGDGHPDVATMRVELARTLSEKGEWVEAGALTRRALETYRGQLPPDHPRIAEALVTLARLLLAGRRAGEAEALLREATRIRRARFGAGDWRTGEARVELGNCLTVLGRRAEGIAELASGYEILARVLGPEHPLARRALSLRERAALTGGAAPVSAARSRRRVRFDPS